MAFFDDLFGGGGDEIQYNALSPAQALEQTYSNLQSTVPGVTAYNKALQPVLTGLQLSNENQIYGPAANTLRQNTYQSILDQLNLGESLSPELTSDITRKLFESGAASGFGASPAGRGNVILQTGLEREARGARRRAEALGATRLLPASSYQYTPQGIIQPETILSDIRGQESIQNQIAMDNEQNRSATFSNLLNTGATLAGFAFGGPIGGAAASTITGAIGGPKYGIGGGGGGFSSILNNLFPPSPGRTQAGEPTKRFDYVA